MSPRKKPSSIQAKIGKILKKDKSRPKRNTTEPEGISNLRQKLSMQNILPTKSKRKPQQKGYSVEFLISGLPPTYNSHNRKHFMVKTKEKNKWHHLVATAIGGNKPKKPLTKYKLTLTRFSSTEPDYDGLVSTWKPVIDALVLCNILEDDKISNSGPWDCRWEKGKRGGGCIKVAVKEEI